MVYKQKNSTWISASCLSWLPHSFQWEYQIPTKTRSSIVWLEVTSDVTQRVIDARLASTIALFHTMDLRRLAQANAMAPRRLSTPTASRNANYVSTPPSSASSPVTPRTRASYPITRSPLESPSISASLPFDWEAARGLRSPPYSPLGPKRRGVRKSGIDSPDGNATATKRAVRKKSLYER
jgi:hypothetical protein